MKDEKLFEECLKAVKGLRNMHSYQRTEIACIVYRQLRHEGEEINRSIEIIQSKYLKEKKKNFIILSVRKEYERLEEEIERCEDTPRICLKGDVVEETVNYYKQIVLDDYLSKTNH